MNALHSSGTGRVPSGVVTDTRGRTTVSQVQGEGRFILLYLVKSQNLETSGTTRSGSEGDNLIDYLMCLTK